jgi:hypothetical protein
LYEAPALVKSNRPAILAHLRAREVAEDTSRALLGAHDVRDLRPQSQMVGPSYTASTKNL